jgi:mannose-6-phosphate isomerase
MCKILDARERLSVQVHPPERQARELGGEPKSEMWFIARAKPGACLFAGVKRGVTRSSFEEALVKGECETQIHAIPAQAGQFLYLPSGRLHAIGAGLVIFEIQQNSDTTYRVFDWNRLGTGGKPRDLHVEESLRCIDFSDVEPRMGEPEGELLVSCPWFRVERWEMAAGLLRETVPEGEFGIFAVISGSVECGRAEFRPGDWFLVPSSGQELRVLTAGGGGAEILRTMLPRRG